MRRKVALSALALGLIGLVALFFLFRASMQQRATSEIAKLLAGGEWGRITYSSLTVDMRLGITLQDAALIPAGSARPVLSVSEARISVSLWDLLRKRKSVAVQIALRRPRLRLTYLGGGRSDFGPLVNQFRAAKTSDSPIRRLGLSFQDGKLTIALTPAARRELAEKLYASANQVDGAIAALLDKAASRWSVVWDEQLRHSLRDAISASLPAVPAQFELELSGSSSYEVGKERFSSRFTLASPLNGKFSISTSGVGGFQLRATGIRFRPSSPPFSLKPSRLMDPGDAEIAVSRFALTREGEAAPTLEADVIVENLTLLPRMPNPLSLTKLSLGFRQEKASASVVGTFGAGSISAKWSRDGGDSLDLNLRKFRLCDTVSSVREVAAQELSLQLIGRRSSTGNPTLRGKLTLAGVRFRGEPVADEAYVEGSLETGYRLASALTRDGRRILKLGAKGRKGKGQFSLDANLRRRDVPGDLLAGLPGMEPLQELRGHFTGDFDLDSRKATISASGMALKTAATTIECRRGNAELTLASAGAAAIPSIAATLHSVFASFPWTQATVQELELTASREEFAVRAGDVSLTFEDATAKTGRWQKWLPREAGLGANLQGTATASGWKLSGGLEGKLSGESGKLAGQMELAGKWPDVQIAVRLGGFIRERPLVAQLAGFYDGRRLTVAESSIDYGSGRVELSGGIDPMSQELLLSYQAEGFELAQLAPGRGLSGKLSSSGRASGTFSHPVVTGTLWLPEADIDCGAIRLPISRATSSFTLSGKRLELRGASLQLMGQVIFLEGVIAPGALRLSLWKDEYSPSQLVSALASGGFLGWQGTGKLSASLAGSFDDLRYRASYEQKGGALNQTALDEVRIRLRGDWHTLNLEEALLRSGEASLALTGSLELGGVCPANWHLQMSDFPVELPASVVPLGKRLALRGRVCGELSGEGGLARPRLTGALEVVDASLLETPFSRIRLAFASAADGVKIEEFTAESEESFVTASGFWGYRSEDTLINLEVPLLDISLFSPLMPEGLGSLQGELGITFLVTENARGEPQLEGTFQSAGAEGLLLGSAHFDRAQGRLTYRRGVIELHEVTLMADGSRLRVSGELPIPGSSRSLDVHVASRDFALAALRPLIPVKGLEFGGKLSSDLTISGTWGNPQLSGHADVDAEELSFGDRFRASRLVAAVEVQDNEVSSVSGQVFFGPSGDGDATGAAENFISFEGSGRYNSARADFDELESRVELSHLSHLQAGDFFKGGLGGSLSLIRRGPDDPYRLSGRLLVRKGADFRLSKLITPPHNLLERKVELALDVELERSCGFRYPPMAMEADVFGELEVGGELSAPALQGELTAASGALMVYRHVVRLVEPAVISFTPANGLVPFVRGKAALELPGVLTSVTFSPEAGGGIYLPSYVAGPGESLTVYVHLNNLLDEDSLNSIELSSEPPLPRETILGYLVGGPQGMVTRTGFESFVQTEALLYSSSRLSRFLEESLRFERFRIWTQTTREGNPLYMNVEKQFTPSLSLRYLRTFFTTLDEREEFAVKYLLYRRLGYKGYLELMQRNRGEFQDEFAVNLVANIRF